MFLWIKLLSVKDSFSLITEKARAAEVLFVPGQVFMIDESAPSPYIRASYSLVSPEDMNTVSGCKYALKNLFFLPTKIVAKIIFWDLAVL
jgi:DNA-binding transcriptional MocR family regulator